ncbi:FAD/NAD(P)-binding domain-containing protein [Microthyrium microscopicum]|uniref:FAD/NAD(P)-binding domain-containing protein n=1 Tax=Microthyrium microscopicum TaxID=703497 RepID=A0A6A6TTF2_9PEZI|nr:FAD/NAD(P)-binding domain-containing protein [Microthyrium microscopicum]
MAFNAFTVAALFGVSIVTFCYRHFSLLQRRKVMDTDPEYQRTPAFPADKLPGSLPVCTIDDDVDAALVARTALVHLQHLDSNLLVHDALWRDLCAFTGTLRTFAGAQRIIASWKKLNRLYSPHDFRIIPGARVIRPGPKTQWVEARFQFTMEHNGVQMNCEGLMRLVPKDAFEWKIWTLVTMLKGVPDWGDVDNLDPIAETSKPERTISESPDGSKHYPCVIVGAGFSGLCLAGRLQALGVPYVVIDKIENVGDIWTSRYQSVKMHTSKEHGQFPFKTRIWGADKPYHLDSADLRTGYQKFVDLYGINLQLSTELKIAQYSKSTQTWALDITHQGISSTLSCEHVVFALGTVGTSPRFPSNLSGWDKYKGIIQHSGTFTHARSWTSLKGAVVGSANSGHDIANDMVSSGLASVTMVQRGRTPVLPVEFYSNIYDSIYNDKADIALSDQLSMWAPTSIARLMSMRAISKMAAQDPERYEALERVGFRVEANMDMYSSLYERFGGHYIDVGVSKKIISGEIKMKPAPPGAGLCGFYENGLVFEDGSKLETDVVVFATGFEGNMRHMAEKLVEKDVAEKLEDWWGVDCEGEIRGAWRPMGHPGIWFTGGNVAIARFFSRFLALQIKSQVVGTPFEVYRSSATADSKSRI